MAHGQLRGLQTTPAWVGSAFLSSTPSSAVNQLCKGLASCLLHRNPHVVFYSEGNGILPQVTDACSVGSDFCVSYSVFWFSPQVISFNIPIFGIQTQMPGSNVIYVKWLSSNALPPGSLAPLPLCGWWVAGLRYLCLGCSPVKLSKISYHQPLFWRIIQNLRHIL